MDQAVVHCTQGRRHLGVGEHRSGGGADLVMACCGDTPTVEALAATTILKDHMPELRKSVS